MNKLIKNFFTISRAKIQIATLSNSMLGIFLAFKINSINLIDFLIYIFLSILLTTFASNINCFYDVDVDKHYKIELAKAIEEIGIRRVKKIIIAETLLALLLIFYFLMKDLIITSFLALLGLFLGYAYSAPPLRIKARGIASPLPVLIGLYMLPILGGWFLIRNDFPLYLIIFVIGYAFMNEGFVLINTCEDYEEDRKEGIKTWAHVFGLRNTIRIAFLFSLLGFLCLYPFITFFNNFLLLIFLLIFSFALSFSSYDIYKLSKSRNLMIETKKYAKKMPLWFSMTRYPLLFAIISTFL